MSEELIQRAIERQMKAEGFAPGYHTYVELGAPTISDDEMRQALWARLDGLNDWVQQQVSEGRAVIERNIETDGYRMRPLRPDDV